LVDRLAGKVAIVTGAGRGIGAGIARVLGAEGASVVLVDIDEKTGNEMVARISKDGGAAAFVKADLTRQADAERVAAEVRSKYGRIDVLCQNVGIYPPVAFDKMTETDWDLVMNVNLKSAFFILRACLPQMESQQYGKVVVTTSITGPRTAIPGLAHYAASKGGLNGLIKGVALEEAKYNITVNGVEPGSVMTEGVMLQSQLGPVFQQQTVQRIPLKRLATPEDIGKAVLFLASDDSAYITGQTIIVDGGQTIVE
jgi:3-oxoacyl-[acyl-carrier protein] reductase